MRDPLRHRCEPRCPLKIGRGASRLRYHAERGSDETSGQNVLR
ncbi:DUF1534 domain-containing protein [Pseudomonas congelans]|nr:DUF1534 domain-containing protein [Pseudomonas congelans]